jgi:hypothetical protein
MKFKNVMTLLLGSFVVFSANSAFAAKKNVCSITINSSDEIELFKKSLPAKNFNFIELTLTPSEEKQDNFEERNNWLMNSCRQGITCDILVISGHFGGSFFGKSGLKLPLETLESASCDKSCSGILHNPKEVFLFGCNTLAGKNQDRRTPEQYAQVLMEDGFSRTEAEGIAAFRYSALGSSFGDRMSRVFSKVPRIYGFSSIAPSGKTAAPFLRDYLKGAGPTYFDWLANVSEKINEPLKEKFKHTALTQTVGAENSNTPVCYIKNDNLSNEAKLKYILTVLKTGGVLELAPYLVEYFNSLNLSRLSASDAHLLGQIYSHEESKAKLAAFVEKPIAGLMKPQVDILNLMVTLKWMTTQDYDQRATQLVLRPFYEETKITIQMADEICSTGLTVNRLLAEKIKPANWTNFHFYNAIGCLKPKNPDFLEAVAARIPLYANKIKQNPPNMSVDKDIVYHILNILAQGKYESQKTLENISSLFSSTDPNFSSAVSNAIYDYVKALETESTYFREQLEVAYATAVSLNTLAPRSWMRSVLFVSRNDKVYSDGLFESALNEKSTSKRSSYAELYQHLLETSDYYRTWAAREILESKDPNRIESTIVMLGFSKNPMLKLLPRFVEIVNGQYPLSTKIESLKIIDTWTSGTPEWKLYFKNVYYSNAPDEVREKALDIYISNLKYLYYDDFVALAKTEKDPKVLKVIERYK